MDTPKSPQRPQHANLCVIEGAESGKVFSLDQEASLGRSADNAISIQDPEVSSAHARIYWENNAYILEDLGSTNHTLINGMPANKTALRDQDKILLGNTLLQFNISNKISKDTVALNPISEAIHSEIQAIQKPWMDTTQLDEDLSQSHHRLSILYRVSAVLGSAMKQADLMERILDLVFEALPADRGYLLLADETHKRLIAKAVRKRDKRDLSRVEISKTIMREVMAKKHAILSEDAMTDQRFRKGASIQLHNIRSAMCVPILSKRQQLLGLIHVDTAVSSSSFSPDDLDLLIGIANQAAIAIENAALYHITYRTNQMLLKLGRGTQELTKHLEKQAILEKTCLLACEILSCTKSSVALLDKEGRHLELCYAVGMEKDLWKKINIKLGEGLCGKVAKECKPILFPNPKPAPGDIQFEPVPRDRYRSNSFLVVPILSEKTSDGQRPVLGAVSVTDKKNNTVFTSEDLNVMTIFASQVGIAVTNAQLYERATIDTLTRLYSRGFFFPRLEEAMHRADRNKWPLALLILDLDHFKSVNDTYGHQVGDVLLHQVGQMIRHAVRAEDCAARYGGEEFCVILPDADAKTAEEIAERIRSEIQNNVFDADGLSLSITVSIGITYYCTGEPKDDLIKRADQALYRAKEQGRNQVVSTKAADGSRGAP